MFFLLAIVAVASAIHSQPLPRPHVTDEKIAYVTLQEPYASPSGLPWQQVIAPYLQQPPAPSSWDRRDRK